MISKSNILRIIPRSITKTLRNRFLSLIDLMDTLSGKKDDLTPPRSLHYIGGGDFKSIGAAYFSHFKKIGQLQPESKVLDIGCGTGRMAIPLIDFMGSSGSYCGFDISQKAIAWCQSHISQKHPQFSFIYADIYNKEYNSKGKIRVNDFSFPCKDESIDFAFATSVFTHMQFAEVKKYLLEIKRCLAPRGRAMLTFYLLDEKAALLMRKGNSRMNFRYEIENGFTIDARTPERAIAFSDNQLARLLQETNLSLADQIYWGGWSGRSSMLEFQDVIVIKKNI